MNIKFERIKSLALLTALIPSFLFSADREDVDTDSTSAENRQMMLEADVEKEVESGDAGYIFDHYPNVYLPTSAHVLVGISATWDQIELEDGSTWKVDPYDASKIQYWKSSDPLVILQNTSWFGSYYFRIVNKADNTSTTANLFQGPFKGGEFSRYIVDIDYSRGVIVLSDATHWEIHPSDRVNFFEWKLSEPVIIGQNAGYDQSWNPYWEGLLINVRKSKKFIRAHQY